MARPNVPKFGNRVNNGDNALYTVYFDEARKNRGQKMIFPNDPRRNSETANKSDPSNTPPSRSNPIKQAGPFGPTGLEDRLGELRRFKNSPAAAENEYYGGRGLSSPAADIRSYNNAESFERSFDKTSLMPQARARLGSGSPPPARSRLRPDFTPTREYQIPDKGPVIPRFGEWNEKDPQSTAGNFTYIFDRVREVRNTNNQPYSLTPTQTPNHPSTTSEPADPDHSRPKSCCFPRWW